MQGNRVEVRQNLAYDFLKVRNESVRGEPDINAFASKNEKSAAVMVWNYHDDNKPAPDSPVAVQIKGITAQKVLIQHFRIDQQHSNSYETWKKMGSPKKPTSEQITTLEKSGQLQLLTSPEWVNVKNGELTMQFPLPRQAVSFLKITW
jgi:xylan 1,4-beta-xylosidase